MLLQSMKPGTGFILVLHILALLVKGLEENETSDLQNFEAEVQNLNDDAIQNTANGSNCSILNDTHTDIEVTELNFEPTEEQATLIETGAENDYPYNESLQLKPLKNNFLLSSFKFHSESNKFPFHKTETPYDAYSHYTVFPKSISPILELTKTKKLFLRFTHGFWDSEQWGRLPSDGFKSGGNGVEMWALLEAESETEAFKQWKQLTNQLSGMFCASIDYIDSTKTTYPRSANFFINEDNEIMADDEKNGLFLMRGSLANEPICTENLTPFIKLLPSRGKSGISSLLDGHKVFDSYWNSMSLDVNYVCDTDDQMCKYDMDINIATVVNVPKLIRRNSNPIPKPLKSEELRCDQNKKYNEYECFILPDSNTVSFHLSDLFGKEIQGHNKLSTSSPSRIVIENIDTEVWSCAIKEDGTYFSTDSNVFELTKDVSFDVYFSSADTSKLQNVEQAPILVSRALTGYSQDKGGLRVTFQNPSVQNDLQVVYYETLPWFMRLYLSSLKIEVSNKELSEEDIVKSTHFVPAVDREAPLYMEYVIHIPRNTTLSMFFQFDKPLLKYEEYPPDANHGFEIESALVVVTDTEGAGQYYLRTPTLLLSLSTPDFSMPYNVIILSSTIMALCFGTIYSLLTKKFVLFKKAQNRESKLKQLLSKFKKA
ncbi:hypothetical protein ACO0QE_001662 [Hanseniaspora vineae]